MMRVGISGAQSVGKTTLLNALRSEDTFKDFQVCDEVTRRVKSYGLNINESGNDNTQKLIMNEHIYNVFMFDNILTDRTVLDGLVYTKYLYINGRVEKSTLDHAFKVFLKVMPLYDHVFYIKPEFDIIDDGVRSTNTKFRDDILELFEQTIRATGVKVKYVGGSVRTRVETIVNIVKGS